MVVVTLTPPINAADPYVCAVRLTLLQTGGLQTTSLNFRTDPQGGAGFCGDVLAPVTVALFPNSGTPAAFDFDAGFSIDYDGNSAGHQAMAVSAFNPAAYSLTPPAGPHSVNVQVQGRNILFQNCTVTSAPAGGGSQYTASCALESSLKASKFEKYDY